MSDENERIWACRTNTGDDGWWYTLNGWGVYPGKETRNAKAAKLTRTEAEAVLARSTSGEVVIVRHPSLTAFDRATFEAIVKTERATPPEGAKPELWTRYLLSLFELALMSGKPEHRDEAVFRASIQMVRERPDLLQHSSGVPWL